MLVDTRRLRRLGIAAAAVAAIGFPAPALGADSRGPRVVRIDPSTGAHTVLAAGAPLNELTGIAVGPSGTVYVSNRGGLAEGIIYSLSAPGFALSPVANARPTVSPWDLLASGSALYSLDDGGLVSIDTTAFAQKLLSPNEGSTVAEPAFIALSGSTLYGTTPGDCSGESDSDRIKPGVVAIDTATGSRSAVAALDCDDPAPTGIAAAPDGTLLIARGTEIIRLNPADGSTTTVAKGGKLSDARDMALTPSGDLIVADATSGLLRISTATGAQSTIASGGDVSGAAFVALDAGGAIYVAASGPAVLKASAAPRQRFSRSGISVSASCRPGCSIHYSVALTGISYATGGDPGTTKRVRAKRSVKVTLYDGTYDEGDSANALVPKALRLHRTVRAKLTLTPVDGLGIVQGKSVKLNVRLVR
jgi:hypothetical protein